MIFPEISLMKGEFTIDVTIEDQFGNTIDYYDNAKAFDVSMNELGSGVAYLNHIWKIE